MSILTTLATAAVAMLLLLPGNSQAAQAKNSLADNPIIYFVMTDRFLNGNPDNDRGYQRQPDGQQEIGTFHGGDLAGITRKLKEGYFKALGVNALWITAPYEQIHGWVVGGNGDFRHYAYHGYWPLDYTRLDNNMGTEDELHEMVDTAHRQGIRILFDVVLNHPGYADLQTLSSLKVPVLWPGWEQATLRDYHSHIDYNNPAFSQWWSGDWVRAGLPGYPDGGRDDQTMQLAYLPDFRTESPHPVALPPLLQAKSDSRARTMPGYTVRDYLVTWLSDWVRNYGIDGFRCDTVKHVDMASWNQLKQHANKALAQWKATHPQQKIDDAPFWMVGEVWGQDVSRNGYFDSGFDSLINFDFQSRLDDLSRLDEVYRHYATRLGSADFDVLSYLSSHDTRLFDRKRLRDAGTALMLAPGGVQIYYGDESARPEGVASASDPQQATRSDMNWQTPDLALLAHWQKLGQFRARHVALARGEHQMLAASPYVFSRQDHKRHDKVVVAPFASGLVSLPVGGVFSNGSRLRDAYSGQEVIVSEGRVSLLAQGSVLLEALRI